MRSNNPVFSRSEQFSGRSGSAYPTNDPSAWGVGAPGTPGAPTQQTPTGPMTMDSVVQKSAMTLGVVVIAAFATWVLTPDITSSASLGPLYGALLIGSLGAFALSMVNSFKRVISPALVLAFAVLEGVFVGAFSKVIDTQFSSGGSGSLVVQAVIGTFAAFAGTLTAYKVFNIQVGDKFRRGVMAAMFGMIALGLLEMVLGAFGSQLGLFGFGGLGLLMAVAGLVLGIFMLILDFDFIEKGIANGLPERESWRAAFALTVSLVWIYTNLLRILAILQQD
ncbi:Bax inhibitor-1/YccA family protein [Nocardioides salsibiostraticola]